MRSIFPSCIIIGGMSFFSSSWYTPTPFFPTCTNLFTHLGLQGGGRSPNQFVFPTPPFLKAGEVREASLPAGWRRPSFRASWRPSIDLSEVKHLSNDCPEHDIINEIGQDLHVELVDDNLLSKASSNSFEEVGNENNVYKDFWNNCS